MKISRKLLIIALTSLSAIANLAPAQFLISEIEPNPLGTDPATQTIEISGTPGSLFTGFVLSIESDGFNGLVDRINDFSGNTTVLDANGLLTLTIGDLENPSNTVVLVSSFSGTTATDIDPANNGVLDISTFGTVYDAVGIPDIVADETTQYGALLGGTDLKFIGDEPYLIFRDASTGSFYAVNGAGTAVYDANGNLLNPASFDSDPLLTTYGSINPALVVAPAEAPVPSIALSGSDLDISFATEADAYYRLKSSSGLSGFANVAGQALIGTGSVESFTEAAPAVGEKAFYLVDVSPTPPAPQVIGLSKVFAGSGNVVTVAGNDLEVATVVTVNGISASFTASGGTLDVTVPVGSGTGFVEVTNAGGSDTSEFVVITDTFPLIYQQEFTAGIGDFTTYDVASNVGWTHATSSPYEAYMQMNGFSADVASNDWLISPAIDLTDRANSYMLLGHERSFGGPALVVQVSTDYAGGDPTLATWTPLVVDLAPDSSFTVKDTGVTSLSAFDGQIIHIAIQYTSTAPGAGNGASDRIHYFAVGGSPVFAGPF